MGNIKMLKVIVTKGLPGSGKTTWSKEWVAKDPTKRVRVNKDDLRALLHGGYWSKGNEKQVIQLEEQIIINSLLLGKSIVVDNTHLATNKDGSNKHYTRIKNLIQKFAEEKDDWTFYNVDLQIKEFNLDPEECIKRDLKRANSVGASIIWQMYWDHIANPQAVEYFEENDDAIIIDVDGTLAQMENRHPFEWGKVGTDSIRTHIKTLAQVYKYYGYVIIILTGRDGEAYDATADWLVTNSIPYDELYYRPAGDNRKDFIVKRELYEKYIKYRYNVHLVVDDRPQVIREWRRLGLPVINANPNDREF